MPSLTNQIMTIANPVNMTMPSGRLRRVSRNRETVNKETASSAGISRRNVADSSGIGRIVAVKPRTSPILTMLEPIALPNANPGSPRVAATMETRISGAEVAKATIVRPINRGWRPRLRAVAEAPCTNRSAPQIRSIRPTSIKPASFITILASIVNS